MRPRLPNWLPALLFVAVGVTSMKAAHLGVFAEKAGSHRQEGTLTTSPDGSTTSTTYGLASRIYRPGDCVRWDQEEDGAATRMTRVVSCDEPHLIEMTGRWAMPILKSYPTDEEWTRLLDDGECGRQVAEYLGGEIDPRGRFYVGAIYPLFQSWAAGDREVWCGVQYRSSSAHADPERSESFTGKVKSQPQGFVYPAGTCLAGDAATRTVTGSVPCTEAHIYETVGDVDASKAFTVPPASDSPAWNQKLGDACTAVAKAAFGGRIPKGVEASSGSIDPASWRTGQHRAECDIARYDAARNPIVLTAPLLPPR